MDPGHLNHRLVSDSAIGRDALAQLLDDWLNAAAYQDYGPNGLQIEGVETIRHVAFAVSATAQSVAAAVEAHAQALIVHHGLFWQFHGPRTLTGPFARRVFPLVRNGINLFAYHLPLDAHPEIGNAAQLAIRIGLDGLEPFGDHKGQPTGIRGHLPQALSAETLQIALEELLQRRVLLAAPEQSRPIRSVGIITGGASGGWNDARTLGLDAYITGEMREHDWHDAREAGVYMFAGGHHATEEFGIKALMQRIESLLGLTCVYIPSENPA